MNLIELAERCEAATGPDRDIDIEIVRYAYGAEIRGTAYPRAYLPGQSFDIPAFTASVDAALWLVPEGFYWRINSNGTALMFKTNEQPEYDGQAATPALAICAAALRAKASEQNNG